MKLETPESMSHDAVVEFVKQKLEEELDVTFKISREYIDRGIYSDLKTDEDVDQRIIVIVHDNVRFTSTGKIKSDDDRKLKNEFLTLRHTKAERKILVLTDSKALTELQNEFDGGIWGGFLDRWKAKHKCELKLVDFPVFKNKKQDGTKLGERSLNKVFTASQLIGAMKFGLIDYDVLSDDDKAKILTIMNRRNYLQPLDLSGLDKKPKE
tara:strand:- start:205 stop:834 length:630 start_codon:yes stop_codon:yes gene_type:complete